MTDGRTSTPALLLLDVTAIVLFATLGRSTHTAGTSFSGILGTAAPFLIGAAVGWLLGSAWDRPGAIRTGLVTAGSALTVGMVLRRMAWGRGTAASFVVVATVMMFALIVGWRAPLQLADRRRAEVRSPRRAFHAR